MTDQKRFEATDDDLPVEFFSDAPLRQTTQPASDEEIARIAVQVHFPSVREQRDAERRLATAVRHEQRDAARGDKPCYIKEGKKRQMFVWLINLEPQFHVMDAGESRFCNQLLWKFRRYRVTRWVTQAQYDWLHNIAATYIGIPGVRNRGRR